MPILIALGRLRQEDCSEFGDLGCRVRPHFKKTNLKVSLLQELIHGPSVTLGGDGEAPTTVPSSIDGRHSLEGTLMSRPLKSVFAVPPLQLLIPSDLIVFIVCQWRWGQGGTFPPPPPSL